MDHQAASSSTEAQAPLFDIGPEQYRGSELELHEEKIYKAAVDSMSTFHLQKLAEIISRELEARGVF